MKFEKKKRSVREDNCMFHLVINVIAGEHRTKKKTSLIQDCIKSQKTITTHDDSSGYLDPSRNSSTLVHLLKLRHNCLPARYWGWTGVEQCPPAIIIPLDLQNIIPDVNIYILISDYRQNSVIIISRRCNSSRYIK